MHGDAVLHLALDPGYLGPAPESLFMVSARRGQVDVTHLEGRPVNSLKSKITIKIAALQAAFC